MHILLIHQAFAAITEPGGTRHHELALYLAENGCRVTIIASPISYLTGQSSGSNKIGSGHPKVQIIRPPVYSALHRSFIHRVINFISFMFSSFFVGLRIREVDLVWGTSPPIFQGVTAWALARLKRVPFLFEVRDLWPAFAIAVGVLKNQVLIRASEWLEGFLYRSTDCLVVNSPGFIQHVKTKGARAIQLVPNGTDVRMFHPEKKGSAFRRRHQLGDKFIALYAGAHGMSNDLDVVIEAAENLRDLSDLAIVLLGDGKEKARLQQRANEMDLDNLIFIAPVPKDEIPDILAAADVCIAILKRIEMYKTVYPNKVFDYMAAGRPVILAIEGVIQEVIETAKAGKAISPGNPGELADAIRFYQSHRSAGINQGMNGRRYVETHFDRPVSTQLLLRIIKKLTGLPK